MFFFEIHDATTLNRQGPDIGTQYRSSIFYHDDSQKEIALSVIEEISLKNKSELKIVTEIIPVADYYIAEDYHQKYILKNNLESCGG